jgi:DNA processing protein
MTATDVAPVISDAGRRYLQFHLTDDVGPVRLRALREHFGTLDQALGASISQLQQVEGIGPRTAEAIFRSRGGDHVEREIQRVADHGLHIVCAEDADYPAALCAIPDPPICLYVRGRIEPQDTVAVAIVGTRKCSHYGREQALRFGGLLGNAGFTVVSGLARGVDAHSHRGALQSGGRTISVLGNGLASIYPPENASLAEEVAACGAVISEVPVDAQPSRENFPRRNRIIAGLSLGIIIIEAGQRSGALITARLASEYNREVFALPGRVDQPEHTAGSNGLIRKSEAKLITCLEDILDELGPVGEVMGRPARGTSSPTLGQSPSAPLPALSENEQAVWQTLINDFDDAEAIVKHCGLDAAQTMSALTSLQLKGLVRRSPGQKFSPRNSR